MKLIVLITALLLLVSCETGKYVKISDDEFVGRWRIEADGMLNGVEFEIVREENGRLQGYFRKLNKNKYVSLFIEEGDKFISSIKRNSNYEFTISEIRIASDLFSEYGLSGSDNKKVIFDSNSDLLIGNNGTNGKYIRLLELK